MRSPFRLFGGLILLSLAGLALFLAGCGSSSKSNQPLDITAGTWTITSSPNGGSGATFTATFTTFNCSNTNIPLGPNWVITSISATVCVTGTLTSKTSGYVPQGLVLGVGANPVPANGTTTLNEGFYADLNSSSNPEYYTLTGTITASTKSISGTFTCGSGSTACTGVSGTYSGTMK